MGDTGTEHTEQADPQPVEGAYFAQLRRRHGQQAQGNHHVLAQRGLHGRDAPGAGTVGQRQQGEQQPGTHGPQQAAGGAAGQVKIRRDQHQPDTHQQHQHNLIGANALAEDQPFKDHGKGRETGEAERCNRHACDFHRNEETHPVPGEQQAAEQQPTPVHGLEFLPARLAGEPCKKR
ncbi:hypothetical protein D3C71_1512470 [compost metagenome]